MGNIKINNEKCFYYKIVLNDNVFFVSTNVKDLPRYILNDSSYQECEQEIKEFSACISVILSDTIKNNYSYYDDARSGYCDEDNDQDNRIIRIGDRIVYSFTYPNNSILIIREKESVYEILTGNFDVAIFHFRMILKKLLILLHTDDCVFHAMGITKGSKGLIIMGNAGSGKTTIGIKTLNKEGVSLLSDEIIFIDDNLSVSGADICASIRYDSLRYISSSIGENDLYYNLYSKCYYKINSKSDVMVTLDNCQIAVLDDVDQMEIITDADNKYKLLQIHSEKINKRIFEKISTKPIYLINRNIDVEDIMFFLI